MAVVSHPSRFAPLRRFVLAFSLLALLAIPLRAVHADIGPKETMEFDFKFESGNPLAIVEGTLLECNDASCTQAEPLQQIGPQRLTCTQDHCSSMAYGYREYHRLSIVFSDGKIRQSNVFGKQYFNARYQVTVREEDLVVKELRGAPNSMMIVFLSGIWLISILLLGMLGLGVVITHRGKGGINLQNLGRGAYLAAWLVATPVLVGSAFISIALLATVAVEATTAALYALLRKRPLLILLTLVLWVNLITQPAMWLALNALGSPDAYLWTLVIEVLVWLVEAILIYLPLRKVIPFIEVLGVSLLFNALSFLVGLALPV